MNMPKVPTLADLKKIADDFEKKVQGASAAIRERWNQQVKPKLDDLEKSVKEKGQRAGEYLQQQAATLGTTLDDLRREIAEDLKIGTKPKAAPDAKPEADAKTDEPPSPAPDKTP